MKTKNFILKFIVILIGTMAMCFMTHVSKAEGNGTSGSLDIELLTDAVVSNDYYHVSNVAYYKEVYYSVIDNDGKYLCFNEDFEYTGKQDEQYIVTVKDSNWQPGSDNHTSKVTLTGIPNGNYKLEFAKKDGEYAKKSQDKENAFIVDPRIENDEFSINDGSASVQTNISLKCKNNIFLYYLDETGKNSEIQWRVADRSSNFFKFTYEKDEQGNNVYTYSPDGDIENITIVNRETTIVKELPWISSGLYGISANLTYGARLQSFYGVMLNKDESEGVDNTYNFVSYVDSLPIPQYKNAGYIYTCTECLKAYTIDKKGTDGDIANGKFVLYNDSIKSQKANLEHFDTYELNGKSYSNVYVVKGWADESEEGDKIETVDGKATIIYPIYHYGKTWESTDFYLYETDSDDMHFLISETFIEIFSGENYTTKIIKNGVQINGRTASFMLDGVPFEYGDVSVEIETEAEDEKQKEVVNQNKPKVTKIVLDENGEVDRNCQETFKFGLFDSSDNLIATVLVKANETKYFDVQLSNPDGENYYIRNSSYLYIAEYANENYTLKEITGEGALAGHKTVLDYEINENIFKDIYQYQYSTIEAVSAVFTDQIIKREEQKPEEPIEEEEKPEPTPEKEEKTPEEEQKVPEEKIEKETKTFVIENTAKQELPKTGENNAILVFVISCSIIFMLFVIKKI